MDLVWIWKCRMIYTINKDDSIGRGARTCMYDRKFMECWTPNDRNSINRQQRIVLAPYMFACVCVCVCVCVRIRWVVSNSLHFFTMIKCCFFFFLLSFPAILPPLFFTIRSIIHSHRFPVYGLYLMARAKTHSYIVWSLSWPLVSLRC